MAYSKVEKTICDMATPIAEENGCFIYDIEYVKEGGAKYLRVFIDREEGVSLDECEAVSRKLSEVLDKVDPIKENYYLEVSSPGVERKLTQDVHFERYMGSAVDIGLYKPMNGSRVLSGELSDYCDSIVTVNCDGEKIDIPRNETAYVKLHFDF